MKRFCKSSLFRFERLCIGVKGRLTFELEYINNNNNNNNNEFIERFQTLRSLHNFIKEKHATRKYSHTNQWYKNTLFV